LVRPCNSAKKLFGGIWLWCPWIYCVRICVETVKIMINLGHGSWWLNWGISWVPQKYDLKS
jgi:hypothetical protein